MTIAQSLTLALRFFSYLPKFGADVPPGESSIDLVDGGGGQPQSRGTPNGVSEGDVLDFESDDIASTQLTVDGEMNSVRLRSSN
jgi:hypothetical protein